MGGGGKGAVPHPRPVKGGPRTQSLHFLNHKLKSEKHKKLVLICCSVSELRRLYTWTRTTTTEVRMKILFRMHIHPNRMGALKDSEVKQLFLNFK